MASDHETIDEFYARINAQRNALRTFELMWAPSGQLIAVVKATSPRQAIAKAPMPYRRYRGEIYATEV
jgi:hypothetical protein